MWNPFKKSSPTHSAVGEPVSRPVSADSEEPRSTHEEDAWNQRGGRIDFEGDSDRVDEASQESFPASDPPSYNPTVGLGSPHE